MFKVTAVIPLFLMFRADLPGKNKTKKEQIFHFPKTNVHRICFDYDVKVVFYYGGVPYLYCEVSLLHEPFPSLNIPQISSRCCKIHHRAGAGEALSRLYLLDLHGQQKVKELDNEGDLSNALVKNGHFCLDNGEKWT